ncbi:MAG: hypothetical protein HQL68_03675 [Magnetococcales bacterium]|nr:hypothetical protein [Magnetococcales bacterium]
MPIKEIVTTIKKGETVTIMGPGTLEFQAPKVATVATKAAGGTTFGGFSATGQGGMATTGPASAGTAQSAALVKGSTLKTIPASLMKGKILGLSLGALNPWLLLGAGAVGGYYYCKKKRFSFF